ncbi:MAG: hypothetical protein H8E44_30615 [Planctomycetes bacterium]|nr:hypothetical protein [Planctomycetota bacterium]MBL7042210.1 hypothetical protein [Pirellulaceae bacterium]
MKTGPFCLLPTVGWLCAFAAGGAVHAQIYNRPTYQPFVASLPEVEQNSAPTGQSPISEPATAVALPTAESPMFAPPPLENPLRPLTTTTYPSDAVDASPHDASHRYPQTDNASAVPRETDDTEGDGYQLTFPLPASGPAEDDRARANRFFFGPRGSVGNPRHMFGSSTEDVQAEPAETVYPMEAYVDDSGAMMEPGVTPGHGYFDGEFEYPRPVGWQCIFGAETTFLVPSRQGSLAQATVAAPASSFSTIADENMRFGPRFWLGTKYGDWSVLGRFWHQNDAGYDFDAVVGGGDRGFTRESLLETYVVDVEVMRSVCGTGAWSFDLGLGFRYVSLEDLAHLSVTSLDTAVPPAVVLATATAITEFDGSGITLSLGGDRPIYRASNSNVKLFWKTRTSLMWGDMTSSAQTAVSVTDFNAPGFDSQLDLAVAATNDELMIGEVQAGLRWEHDLRFMPAVAFAHIAFEYQYWDADVGWARAQSQASVAANAGTATAFTGSDLEMNLVGFNMGAGLVW